MRLIPRYLTLSALKLTTNLLVVVLGRLNIQDLRNNLDLSVIIKQKGACAKWIRKF